MRRALTALLSLAAALTVAVMPGPADAATTFPLGGIAIPGYRLAQDSPEQLNTDLDRVAATGVQWLRTDIVWGDIEYVPGQFNWSTPDRIAAAAHARGLKLVGIATVLPAWARPAGTSWNYGPRTDAERAGFAQFVQLAAARYRGTIDTWEIWNEMNSAQFWAPTPSTSDYGALLRAAYPAVKRGNPYAFVIAGGTGWAGAAPDINSVDWYKGLYAGGLKPYFDAATVHPYFDFSGINTQEMARAAAIRGVMDTAGDYSKKLWGTEIGAPTGGSFSLSEAAQAAFVPQAYDTWSKIHDHGPLFWYTLKDTAGTDREAYFGLVRTDGSQKPSYGALTSYLQSHAADAASPVVALTSPAPGSSLSGTVTLTADARDDVAVAKVDFLVDGVLKGTDTTAPYSVALSTLGLSNASHAVTATAYDTSGNRTTSTPVAVTVTNSAGAGTTSPPVTNGVTAVSAFSTLPSSTGVSFKVTMTTTGTLQVDHLIVAIRNSANQNYDTTLRAPVTLAGVQGFTGGRTLPRGTYTYRVAYDRNGVWTDLRPQFTVA